MNISRLALVAVLTVGSAGIMGLASSLIPTSSAIAQDCRVSPTACPPTSSSQPSSSSSSEPSSSSSSEPSSSSSSEPSSSSSEPPRSSEPPTSSEPPPEGGGDPDDLLNWTRDSKVDCDVRDGERPTNDFWVVNIGSETLKAGLRLRYIVPASGDRGAFVLPRDIDVGKKGRIRDFLSKEVPSGSECRIQILPALPQP